MVASIPSAKECFGWNPVLLSFSIPAMECLTSPGRSARWSTRTEAGSASAFAAAEYRYLFVSAHRIFSVIIVNITKAALTIQKRVTIFSSATTFFWK